jgi:hypothetical protein
MGLFNTTHNHFDISRPVTQRVTEEVNVNVQEHRAATDDSIRYMEEAHEKALKNILYKVKIKDNHLTGEAFICEKKFAMNQHSLYVKFSINGKEYLIEEDIDGDEFRELELMEMADMITMQGNRKTRFVENRSQAVIALWMGRHLMAIIFKTITGRDIDPETF